MKDDWRWKAAILAYLAIPVFGFWQSIKHYQILHNVQHVEISEIPERVTAELQQFQLNGFEIYGNESSKSQMVCVAEPKTPDEEPAVVVLFFSRSPDPGKSFDEVKSSRVAKGLVTRSQTRSKEWALETELELPDFAPEEIYFINVDNEYFEATVNLWIAYSLMGLIPLAWAYMKIDEANFKKRSASNYVSSSVALQVSIAKQNICRY